MALKNIKSKSRTNGDKIAFCVYAYDIGNGIVKVGYTNDLDRREGEHRRKYGQATLLGAVQVSTYIHGDNVGFIKAKASAEVVECQLLDTMRKTYTMVKDAQNGDTERFYMKPEAPEVEVKIRKTYTLRVS